MTQNKLERARPQLYWQNNLKGQPPHNSSLTTVSQISSWPCGGKKKSFPQSSQCRKWWLLVPAPHRDSSLPFPVLHCWLEERMGRGRTQRIMSSREAEPAVIHAALYWQNLSWLQHLAYRCNREIQSFGSPENAVYGLLWPRGEIWGIKATI